MRLWLVGIGSTVARRTAKRRRRRFADRPPGSLTGHARTVDGVAVRDFHIAARPAAILLLAAIALVLSSCGPAIPGVQRGSGDGARYRMAALPPPGPLAFTGAAAASDQQVVRQVIADARPEARRLVEAVAALVTVSIGVPGEGAAGMTTRTSNGYSVVLDLGGVYRRLGMRGVRRLVLHEMAHVVDDALVPDPLKGQLDAATPAGFGCDDGKSGGCAARAERFAESFAKWATGDIGNDLYLGYRVPPPTSLAGWGAPLAALLR
jgi:hypothetical protein